jgi:apolipoprotein N-acyltransferase
MELGGHRIATTICLEDLFHRHVSSLLAEGSPTLLVNAGSDAWFPASDEPRLHLLLSRGRAVEHHVFEVRATSAGTAAVVDPLGRVVSRLKDDEPSGLARVRWVHVPTIYERVGDWPAWAAAVLTLLLAAASRPRKETESSGSRARPSARRERSAAANVEPIARASEPS